MHPLALSGNYKIAACVILGMAFGFLLVSSGMAWRKSVNNMFLFKDGAFLKTFLFSLSVGMLLFYFAGEIGLVKVRFHPSSFWGMFMGALLCGTGLALCGQYPCSTLCLLASGRVYVLFAAAGMLLAIPAARLLSGAISEVNSWSAPFDFPRGLQGYASTETVVLWMGALAAIFALFTHLVLRGDSKE